MSAWSRRRARKAAEKRRRAYDRLHGVGAVSRAPASRRNSDWGDDVGDILVDLAMAFPRGVLWILSKVLD